MPMTTANKLTIARVLMIPVFLVILYWGFPGSSYVALTVYIIACLTDLADGYIARHYNQVSDFGKFMDPLADKCLVMAALCWFVENGDMVGWVLAAVLLREFAVSGMRRCRRGEGACHRRRLVRQGQNCEHDGLHLPDALRHPPLAQPRLPGRHPRHNGLFRRRVFREKLGRVPGELTNNPQREEPSVMILSAVLCALFPYAIHLEYVYVLDQGILPRRLSCGRSFPRCCIWRSCG